MTYTWQVTGLSPTDAAELGVGQPFDTQAQAEDWLGVFYTDLAEAGGTAVTLLNVDRVVYGPMLLED